MGELSYNFLKNETVAYLKKNFPKNSKVLDIGAGDGVWADLLKDYFIIDGVEVFEPWVEKYELKKKYNELFVRDIRGFNFKYYDIIIMGDVLEHLSVNEAREVFHYAYTRSRELVIAVPYLYKQEIADDGNQYQVHLQPDLTYEKFLKRYYGMEILHNAIFDGVERYGYFIKEKEIPEENRDLKTAVYAICKNELHFLDRFLKFNNEADAICILDTGSDDGTWERLQELSKKNPKLIISQKTINPWRFDDARNESLKLIPEWADLAVAIDLDEYFDFNWTNRLKRQWKNEYFKVKYKWEEFNHWANNYAYKRFIHSNKHEAKWYYAVHEMLGESNQEPLENVPEIDMVLHHRPKRDNHPREDMYLNLLKIRSKEDYNNNDSLCYAMLGSQYEMRKNYAKALYYYKKGLKIKSTLYEKENFYPWTKQAYIRILDKIGLMYYYDKKDYKKSYKYFLRAVEQNPSDERLRKNLMWAEKKKNENNYKITVYAICKNEEQFVEKWVKNMSEADHIVVLDTGSTDGTVEKLRGLGVKVEIKEIKPWRFDVARNESMRLIPKDTDICVCTDLDEEFEAGWANTLREHWYDDANQAKYTYSWSHDENNNPLVQIWYEKIHDNSGNWYWKAPVHEGLVNNKIKNKKWVFLPKEAFHLHHYPDKTKPRSQYLNLLKLAIEEDPSDVLSDFYYGRELTFYLKWREAIEHLEGWLTRWKNSYYKGNIARSYSLIGRSYWALGDLDKAEINFIQATKILKGTREPYIELIKFYYNQKRWYSLIGAGNECLKIKKIVGEWYEDMSSYRHTLHDFLSLAYYNIGDFKNAKKHIDIALSFSPSNERFLKNKSFIEKALIH